MMDKVRWGVLGTAKIGMEKVIPAMQASRYCDISAIGSRNIGKARKAAKKLSIPKAYGSYEELLKDSEIDAVYIPLPNHLHVEWSIKSLQAGKHVLCEKPIGITAAEAQNLLNVSLQYPHQKIMEAFMYRYHPQWRHTKKMVSEGKIGELLTIHSFFSYHNRDPDNIRNRKEMGGGGLMDIGCYCISLSRFIHGCEPRRVLGIIENDPEFMVDRVTSGILDFGTGTSTFTCSIQMSPHQRVMVFGTRGHIEIEIPFNAPSDRSCRIWHHVKGKSREIGFDTCNQYAIQGDLFSLAVLNDTDVPTPLTDGIQNMKIIEAILSSAQNKTWVKP